MCTLEEVRISVDAILAEGNSDLMLLHAITSYPTHSEHVNLAAMQTLMKTFPQLDVGYSDHTLSPVACLCAVAMGARIIEKHFTYDKKASGPDHILSADPDEMKWLVREVRNFEIMRGNGIKKPAKSEDITRRNNRKSIVIERSVKKGNRLTETDISIKRPGYGIAPAYFEQIIGRKLVSDMEKDDVLSWGDLG
jgi:N-acetylneuraminate synthase